jgi:hypothetical protein
VLKGAVGAGRGPWHSFLQAVLSSWVTVTAGSPTRVAGQAAVGVAPFQTTLSASHSFQGVVLVEGQPCGAATMMWYMVPAARQGASHSGGTAGQQWWLIQHQRIGYCLVY